MKAEDSGKSSDAELLGARLLRLALFAVEPEKLS